MKKRILTIIVTLLIGIPNAFAANWVQFDEKQYIDTESILNESHSKYYNIYSVWTKSLNNGSEDYKNLEAILKKKIWYTMDKQTLDCDRKTMHHNDTLIYDLQNNAIYTDQPNSVLSIVPESNGEILYNYVCRPRMNNTPKTNPTYNYDSTQNNNVRFKVKSKK